MITVFGLWPVTESTKNWPFIDTKTGFHGINSTQSQCSLITDLLIF